MSSEPEYSDTVIGLFLDLPIVCFNGGGCSLGNRLYGTSHLCFCASVMWTLNRSCVSCLNKNQTAERAVDIVVLDDNEVAHKASIRALLNGDETVALANLGWRVGLGLGG
ncbi:hypothetical protein CFP56_041578 [Quercus suber]|uniref:Uncharacterized protein n=1 Tax=Quercus suber TaxID=58331 RepID=A0AAW0IV74_QUESU